MNGLTGLAAIWWIADAILLLATAWLAWRHARSKSVAATRDAPLSVIVPLKAPSPYLGPATTTLLAQDHRAFDLSFAVLPSDEARVRDAIEPAARQAARPWRIVPSFPAPAGTNPKIANLLPAYDAAAQDLIVTKDAGTFLQPNHLRAMSSLLGDGIGLVVSAPIMREPGNLVAWIECAIVNGLGARMLLAAAGLGRGVGIGAVMLFRRSDVEAAGGLASLLPRLADDHGLCRLLAQRGLRTVMTPGTVDQTLGPRGIGAMVQRHMRWAVCRRTEEPLLFAIEPLTGCLAALAAAAVAGPGLGLGSVAAVLGTLALWASVEIGLSRALGWPTGLVLVPALVAREALLPVIWIGALLTPPSRWLGRAG